MTHLCAPSCNSTSGWALTLWYHTGCLGAPPMEATAAYAPSCSTRMSGILRIAPDLAPRVVRMITGNPRRVPPSAPSVRSYNSTCSRTCGRGLGTYSPSKDMPCVYTIRRGGTEPECVLVGTRWSTAITEMIEALRSEEHTSEL